MKKLLLSLALLTLLSSPVQAAVGPAVPPLVPVLAVDSNLTPVWAFLGFTGFAAFVVYANATGIEFPLCGVNGWKCYGEYVKDKNGAY